MIIIIIKTYQQQRFFWFCIVIHLAYLLHLVRPLDGTWGYYRVNECKFLLVGQHWYGHLSCSSYLNGLWEGNKVASFRTTRLATYTHLLSNVMRYKRFLSHLILTLSWCLKTRAARCWLRRGQFWPSVSAWEAWGVSRDPSSNKNGDLGDAEQGIVWRCKLFSSWSRWVYVAGLVVRKGQRWSHLSLLFLCMATMVRVLRDPTPVSKISCTPLLPSLLSSLSLRSRGSKART